MKLRLSKIIFCLAGLFLLSSCAEQKLNSRSDYQTSRQLFRQNKIQLAEENQPKNEPAGFISEFENLWLKLQTDSPDPKRLQKVSDDLELRKTNYISKETKRFFYKETEDGYFPAEHEVILFHVTLAMAYAKQNDQEGSCVETRKASEYMQNKFDDRHGEFDDPALRLWMAGLWIYCGEWNEAQVDLRVADQLLGGKNRELKKILARNEPPKTFHVALLGDGPEVTWTGNIHSDKAPQLKDIKFIDENLENEKPEPDDELAVLITENKAGNKTEDKTEKVLVTATSENWYRRHVQRNTLIREIFDSSKYMLESAGATTKSVAHKGSAAMVSGVVMTTGVIIGGGLIAAGIYVLSQAGTQSCNEGCGEVIGAILVAGWVIIQNFYDSARSVIRSETKSADDELRESIDISERYRFVRFLPSQVAIAASDKESSELRQVRRSAVSIHDSFLRLKSKTPGSEVLFYHWSNP